MLGFFKAHFSKDRELYRSIKCILGFYPSNIFLYKLAFRHRSTTLSEKGFKRNNERLEYLGDAVLGTVVAYYLYKKYPLQNEGFLTEMRSKLVSRANLHRVSLKMRLHRLIEQNTHGNASFKSMDGDALEALIGAMFLDKGYRFSENIIIKRILQIYVDVSLIEHTEWNFKSKLIDWGQKSRQKISFQVVESSQVGHKKQYKVEVSSNEKALATAFGNSIKAAEQLAAEYAYKNHIEPLLLQEKKSDL